MFKHILIPTDGSEISARAARKAIRFASQTGARVTLYRAVGPGVQSLFGEGYRFPAEAGANPRRRAANADLEPMAKLARDAGVPCQTVVGRSAVPEQGILKAVGKRKCDAIFMASHGRRGVARAVLGSVAAGVIARSSVPVLVYR
jgi:nucleotide-binding universal stress UspA family protein